MFSARRTAAVAVAVAALAALGPNAPVHASGTLVNSSSGVYAGNIRADLIQPLQLTVLGTNTTTCTSSGMLGTIDFDGAPLGLSSLSMGGCSGTGVLASPTAQGLPWSGTVVYSPFTSSAFTVNGFTVQATILGTVNCTYGGNVTARWYNGTDANRPVVTSSEAQIDFSGLIVPRTSGSFLCPSSLTITEGVYALTGESSPGSGSYGRSLFLSPG